MTNDIVNVERVQTEVEQLTGKDHRQIDIAKIWSNLKELYSLQHDAIVQPENLHMTPDGVLHYSNGEMFSLKPNHSMWRQMGTSFKMNASFVDYANKCDPQITADVFNRFFEFEAKNEREAAGSGRAWMVRTYKKGRDFTSDPENPLVGRAWVSNKFRSIDHLPIFRAVLETTRTASKEIGREIKAVDQSLHPDNFYLRFICPELELKTHALNNYRDPETGNRMGSGLGDGGVCTGFIVTNSETGHGRFGIAPRLFIGACMNGQIYKKEGLFKNHVGAKLEEGIINWSLETRQANLAVVISQIKDAIKRYLQPDFLGKKIQQIETAANIKMRYPVDACKRITKDLGFSAKDTEDTLTWLANQGGARNAFDVAQAITKQAQKVSSKDRWLIESFVGDNVHKLAKYDVAFTEAEVKEELQTAGVIADRRG